jgi:hypothetical protein
MRVTCHRGGVLNVLAVFPNEPLTVDSRDRAGVRALERLGQGEPISTMRRSSA